jgi:outer membrane protein assembly factor BamB
LDPGLRVGLYGDIWSVIDDTEHTYRVYCLSRDTGEIIWEKTSYVGVPKVKRHTKATHANCTPATDGKQVVAFFASEGLYCYTIDGELLWKKDFGVLDSGFFRVPVAQWEFASSPVIDGDRVIILCDVQKDSFIAAFDLKTGKELWRTPRKDVPTWGTPTVHRSGSRHQVIANGFNFMAGFDAKTGERLWWLAGGGDIPVPTPIVADDLVYLTSSHGGPRPVFAVKTSATGEITLKEGETSNEHVAWFRPNSAAYMQTPLAVDGLVYTCMDNGVLTCMDAKTGSVRFKARVGSGQTGFTASSVYADGRLFLTSEDGDIYVYAAGPEEKLLATNEIGEICMATPAISRGDLFVRTDKHLYCIGK